MAEQPPQTEPGDDAHDVLAADEFPVGSPDPGLTPARDVLAADEFAVGSGDPALHRGPFAPPEDRIGAQHPHDVLAAEEFAVPAGPVDGGSRSAPSPGRLALAGGALVGAGAAVFSVLHRRRRRSRMDRLRRIKP